MLETRATELEGARTAVQSSIGGTTWIAASADRQRAHLAGVDARARTSVDELRAGGAHLRRLATAIETLEQAMLRAWTARRNALQNELSMVSADLDLQDEAGRLRQQLASLPHWSDPYWSQRVPQPVVPLPAVTPAGSTAPYGPYAPPAVVRIDAAQVRALADVLDRQADVAAVGRAATANASALPFGRLNAYGLPGSSTGAFLSDVVSTAGDHAVTAVGWVQGAFRARALASLVEQADGPAGLTAVLNDPRAEGALDLAELLAATTGDEEVGRALTDLDDVDAEWMLENVPGLEGRVAAAFPTLESLALLNGWALTPGSYAREELQRGDELGRNAKDLKPGRAIGTKAEREAKRAQYKALIRQMKAARATGARYEMVAARIPGTGSVLRAGEARLNVPVLRNVPALSILFTGVGIYDDTTREVNPLSPEHAVIKNVGSTAAGLATTTLVAGALAGTAVAGVALAPIALGVLAGVAVGYGVGKAIEHYDDIADGTGDRLSDAGGALSDAGGAINDGVSDAWNSVFG